MSRTMGDGKKEKESASVQGGNKLDVATRAFVGRFLREAVAAGAWKLGHIDEYLATGDSTLR